MTRRDFEIMKELDNVHADDYDKRLEIFAKRADPYRQCARGIPDPYVKAIVEIKEQVILNSMAIINTQKTIQSDIAKIFSRLDDLESESESKSKSK
jgi:hypothetical protein